MSQPVWRICSRATAVAVTAVLLAAVAVGWLGLGEPGSPATAGQPPAVSDGVAPTELDARAEAVGSGQPVEVLAFRNEQRDVTANPDGTMTLRQYTAPVRMVKDGTWVAVDTTLAAGAGGRLAPAAATVDVTFSGGGDGPLVQAGKGGRSISLGWEGTLPAAAVDGATATYPEVLSGVDLVVTALVDGFSHTLVVKTAQAAANPALAAIEMPLTLDGAQLRSTDAGGVEVVDVGSGGVMLAADAPMMWDSGGGQTEAGMEQLAEDPQQRAQVAVAVEDGALRLVPDPAVLTGPEVTYPVYIDPIFRDDQASAWAMVDSGFPSEEYWKFDGKDSEGLGRCPPDSGQCNSSLVKRLLYRLPTGTYDGKDILSAEFVAVLKDHWANDPSVSHQANLYLMSSGFSTSTNWSNQPSGSLVATADPPAPSGDCSGLDDGGTEWNVLPEVQDAADAGRSTLTFGLRNASESDSTRWMRFCGTAYLRVNYNTPPDQPLMEHLSMTPGAGCSYDLTGDSFVNRLPKLRAFLFDDDRADLSEEVRAEFQLIWGSNTWTKTTGYNESGSRFEIDLATQAGLPALPTNTPIGWIVRAYDGDSFSPWSWSGEQTRCRFVLDPTAPDPPTITSTDFPDNDTWLDRLGEYGRFTFASTSPDVVAYRYDFTNDVDDNGQAVPPAVVPAGVDRTATVSFMPTRTGPHTLTVQALDQASNPSTGNSHQFAISARPAVGGWALADPAGSAEATGADGSAPAAAGPGVVFGVAGPGANTAARLDGSGGGWLEVPTQALVDTGSGFAASAWVRVDDLSRDQTAVSVNGTGEAGFALGYHAATQDWMFEIPDFDLYRFTQWRLTSPADNIETDEWAHLAGVYDPGTGAMWLYVNGTLAASGQRGSSWSGTGAVQIGRSYMQGSYAGYWDGDLAEVRVFDRVVFAEEIAALASLAPQRLAYWQLNDAQGGVSPEHGGGAPLSLHNGATIYQQVDPIFDPLPLVGTGHLALDGVDDYAAAGLPVVDTGDSFTVTARVRLPSAQPAETMTVLAAPGSAASMFAVRYSAEHHAWELVFTSGDTAGAVATSVVSTEPVSAGPRGQLIAVVYNAFTDQMTLHVDGVPTGPLAEPHDQPWEATGGFQLGRSLVAGTFVDYLSGVVDDVRVYDGVADASTIQLIGDFVEQPEL